MSTDAPELDSGQQPDVDMAVVSKKIRKPRTRGLARKLQNQVEFYFGDANLPKDKFLQQKMSEDANGYIPVQVIANFKKMRLLTGDTALVVKAIRNSSLLELSDDSLGVRRVTPLPDHTPSDVDERTVYVENLPTPSTTHDNVKKMFKTFGDVIYVSLPRFKVSGDIKGFAFVEFSKKEGADSAVSYFKSKESTSSSSDIKPADVSCDYEATPIGRKRKREEDDDQAIEVASNKKLKKSSKSKETEISTATQPTESAKSTKLEIATKGSSQVDTPISDPPSHSGGGKLSTAGPETTAADGEASVQATRKRKHDTDEDEVRPSLKVARIDSQSSDTQDVGEGVKKKRKKNRQHKKKPGSTPTDKELDQLRVMSKTEWSSMKQIFKDVQKDHMKKLKDEQSSPQEAKPKEGRGFVGECLVRVECVGGASVERLQEVCSVFGEVAYVDLQDGDKEGYVRYKTSGCVSRLLEADQDTHPNTTFHTLPDAEERAYFLKTQAQRRQRHLKGKKHNQMRGQDKVINKALRRGRGYGEVRYSDTSPDKSCDKSADRPSERVPPVKSKRVHIKFSDSDTEQ